MEKAYYYYTYIERFSFRLNLHETLNLGYSNLR